MSISGIALRCGPERVDAFDVTLTGDVSSGDMDKIEDTVGVYYKSGESGDIVAWIYRAPKIVLPKDTTTGVTFTAGDKVYYNDHINKVTSNSSGNTLVGIALEDAVAADTTLLVDFDGKPRS